MGKTRANVNSFFHGPVDMGSGNSADYVVVHAARQRHRGKNPSATYRDIANPIHALKAAEEDIELRTLRTFDHGVIPYYLADFSGRVAIMHAPDDERQKGFAGEFVDARMRDGRCVGAVILDDFYKIEHLAGATNVNPDGTAEVPYIFAP